MRISSLSVFAIVAILASAPGAALAQEPTPASAPAPSALAGPSPQGAASQGAPSQAAAPKTVNLNTATLEQLETLPGIGRRTAERILEYRTKVGSFKKIEELMNVKGIGEKSFLKIKPLVSAPPRTDNKAPGD